MSDSSELAIHHRDIYGYCLALQNFLNVTEVKHDRSSSPRAQKARAKLLKLSASQFYELSTDVFDELQRRRSTGHGQPEYLLPKAGFHIKRNQARQKLANLSQTRFNDLVDDILFEIKRRGYDTNPESVEEPTKPLPDGDYNAYDRKLDEKSLNQSNENTISTSDGSLVQVPPTATIQASQIIPKKASIDWSSEEDDDEVCAEEALSRATHSEAQHLSKVISMSDRKNDSSSSLNGPNPETPVLKSFQDDYHYYDLNETPLKTRSQQTPGSGSRSLGKANLSNNLSPTGLNVQGAITSTDNIVGGISKLVSHTKDALEQESKEDREEQLGALKKKCARLEAELNETNAELFSLKDENKKLKETSVDSAAIGNIAPNISFQKDLTSLSSQVSSLSIDNEKLKQQISELELKAKSVVVSKVGNHADDAQSKYSSDLQSFSQYISENGSVPFEIIKLIFEQIKLLFVIIQAEKGDDGKRLFETLAHVSASVHQMLMLVDVPQFKDEVILLKASLSHAITAVRYHAVYHSILPRITVQAALSDLAFAVCNLIDSTKIKVEQITGEIANLKVSKESDINVTAAPHTPVEPAFGPPLSQELLNKPRDLVNVSGDTIDEMSPVKPLKITQRANMSPNTSLKPSSARKTSGSLLFSSMIETKSPLSSSHSSKVYSRPSRGLTDDASEVNSKRAVEFDSSVSEDQRSREKVTQQNQEIEPATPTKSANNSNVKVVNGTPSLPTPIANSSGSAQKQVPGKSLLKTADPKMDEGTTQLTESTAAAEASLVSLNKSFEDKLKNFANNTGIGLRVDKQTKERPNEERRQAEIQKSTVKHESPSKTQSSAATVDSNEGEFPPNTKKVNYSSLRQPEANPTPSKLTEKFMKTFDDMSENDSEDDSRSDQNDNSNVSDDGSTYMALKQSLRQSDTNKQEERTITKATVYSPRAQQNSQFNDSETRFGSDTDLSDVVTDFPLEKTEGEAQQMPPKGFLAKQSKSDASEGPRNESSPISKLNAGNNIVSSETPFVTDLNATVVKQENFDDSSDYQFVPLKKKESIENEPKSQAGVSNNAVQPEEEAEDEVDFDFDAFDIENPDNTLSELLLYLEHQTVQVISTIQSLLTSIKQPKATKGDLRKESNAINQVIRQMVDATSVSMNQSRNASLKEHGSWVVKSLEDCSLRMITLCELNAEGSFIDMKKDADFADKHFKQRLAGIAFDVAKCTKELVKTVEEASLKEEIAFLNSRLN